ncbi:PKD domain-containing protein [Natrinema salaciae]|uniref:PKD domain-containing protein n=1 Tax=Natrinema salaciae TaxID=1186196 RepID=UPI001114580B|nr:PKD domain-containing protein [Natrinema salaciae]
MTIAVDPTQPVVGEAVSFICTRAFAEYEWVIVGPTGFEQYTGQTASTTFEEAGEYTAHLTIKRSDGESTYVSKSGQVLDSRDTTPTAEIDFSPQDPVYNPIEFDASGSTTPTGEIESYDWYWRNIDANPDWDVFDGEPSLSGETVEESFSEQTTFKVGLEVTNTAGNTDRDTVEFTPQKNPDAPTPVINIYPDEITPKNPVTLDASESTTPVGSIESYDWFINKYDDSGGKTEELQRSGEVVEEHWETDVLHTVTLRVENSEGVSYQANDSFRPEE